MTRLLATAALALALVSACGKDAPSGPPAPATVTIQTAMRGSDCDWTWHAQVSFSGDVSYELYAPGAAGSPTRSGTFQGSVTETGTLLGATGFFYQWKLTSGAWHDESPGAIRNC